MLTKLDKNDINTITKYKSNLTNWKKIKYAKLLKLRTIILDNFAITYIKINNLQNFESQVLKKWIERTDNLKYLLSKLDENTTQNDKEFEKKYKKI